MNYRHLLGCDTIGFSFDDFSYVVAVVLERVWIKKPGKENNVKGMSRILGFATDLFRSNVRVILQYNER